MRKGVLIAAFVVLVGMGVVCTAFAEPRAYTYGGSGMDVLVSITVSDDGCIAMTGASDSSDGTFSGRTKTGHSGWVLCVDAQGEVMFSFLTRRGTRDYLHLPVFHEDGSLTVVLDTDTDTGSELELIRLNREGDVVSRRLLKAREGATSVLLTGVAMDEGILCDESMNSRIIGCTLFDWDGERLREWSETDMPDYIAWTGRHAIRNMGDGEWLESIDASGVETPLLRVMQWQKDNWDVYYNALVSLEDGGAAAVGRAWSGVSEGEGCIARWDAQGNPVFS